MSSATIAQRAGLKEDAVITHSKLGSQGRLGNQLFQYAFLFAQARRTRCRAFVNGDAPGFTLRPFALDSSGTVVLVSHHEYMGLYEREISTRVEEPTFQYDSDLIRARDACDYSGYFQSERYFCQFAKDVRSLFLLDDAATSDAERWKRWITVSKNDVVAVHVRRGDYLGKPAVHANLHRTTYHQRAIELLRCRLARPCNVLVFSDDIPWCRRHRLSGRTTVFDTSPGSTHTRTSISSLYVNTT